MKAVGSAYSQAVKIYTSIWKVAKRPEGLELDLNTLAAWPQRDSNSTPTFLPGQKTCK